MGCCQQQSFDASTSASQQRAASFHELVHVALQTLSSCSESRERLRFGSMRRILQVLLIGMLCSASPFAGARGSRSGSSRSSRPRSYSGSRSYASHSRTRLRSYSYSGSGSSRSTYCASCTRDSLGHIKRSPEAKHEFQRSHPCPATGKTSGRCPGYVVDHVVPLKRGGADAPSNMQWQTTAEAKAKDKTE
jgi:hypothetical protein